MDTTIFMTKKAVLKGEIDGLNWALKHLRAGKFHRLYFKELESKIKRRINVLLRAYDNV